jgi:hypothetical protein
MKITNEDILEAIKTSDQVEVSKDKKKVRRAGNKELP